MEYWQALGLNVSISIHRGHTDFRRTEEPATALTRTARILAHELPSIDEQVKIIMERMVDDQADMRDGDVGFAISTAWLNRVLARSSQSDAHGPYEKSVLEGDIGPIDNAAILLSG